MCKRRGNRMCKRKFCSMGCFHSGRRPEIRKRRKISPKELAKKKNMMREAANKMEFDRALLNVFKEQLQVDVWLKPGDQTDAIPAHKLILMARSKVFSNILESDDFKASLLKETVTLSEMKHDELETFLEFIYNGSLSDTKIMQHVRILYLAADKYDIPHLQDLCRNQFVVSMNTSNVFDVLELAKIHSDQILEHAVSEFIASNMEETSLSSSKFMPFVESNPGSYCPNDKGSCASEQTKKVGNMRIDHVQT